MLWMKRKLKEENERTIHGNSHQNCKGFCAWGYSNVKHGDHSGGMGRAGARKKAGWHKGWMKKHKRDKA